MWLRSVACRARLQLLRPVQAGRAGMGTKRSAPPRIGTHSGGFHCDEALGIFLLRQTELFRDAEVVRTRDPVILKDLDAVIDVGSVYDPSTHRYDHHQRGFEEVLGDGYTIRLSSAGLVYKHFGKEIIAGRLGLSRDDPVVDEVFKRIYKSFIAAIDGVDNGLNQYDPGVPHRYEINTDLGSRVSRLNPWWNEDADNDEYDRRFQKASEMCGREFLDEVDYWAKCWVPARQIVQRAIEARAEVHPSKSIIRLDKACPWKEHLLDAENAMGLEDSERVLFVLYKDEKENMWRVQAVNMPGGFDLRCGLHAEWRGLRGSVLEQVSGIPGCTFVHASGFIGGNVTYDGALKMAVRSLGSAARPESQEAAVAQPAQPHA